MKAVDYKATNKSILQAKHNENKFLLYSSAKIGVQGSFPEKEVVRAVLNLSVSFWTGLLNFLSHRRFRLGALLWTIPKTQIQNGLVLHPNYEKPQILQDFGRMP